MIHTDPPFQERGPARNGQEAIVDLAVMNIRPPLGEEWVIIMIDFQSDCLIQWTDGTVVTTIATETTASGNAPGSLDDLNYVITYNRWLRVLNNSGGVNNMGYSGYLRYV